MKKVFGIFVILCSFVFLFTLSSCGDNSGNVPMVDEYIVSFDSHGGSIIGSQNVKKGEKAASPEDPEKKGYTFLGWFDGDEEWDFDSMVVEKNINLEAKWKILQFNVILNNDNEDAGLISGGGTFDYGQQVTLTATPKKWYDFFGWYIDDSCASKSTSYSFELSDANVTVTAKWELKEEIKNFRFSESSDGESIVIHEAINKNITSIYIPEYVSEITYGAFRDCTTLESIELPFIGKNRTEAQFLGYIFGAQNYSNNYLYVPKSLKKVILHDGFESIPNNAFSGCKYLETIEIPNSIKTIGQGVFDECDALKYTKDELGLYLGNPLNPYLVFVKSANTSLESISINRNTKFIMPNSLKGCNQMKSISAPFFGTTIESNQYLGYLFGARSYEENKNYIPSSLTKVAIYDGYQEIDEQLFYEYYYLKEVIIPKTVTRLSKGMFRNFESLESITMPFLGEVSTSKQYIGYIFGADSYLNNKDYIPTTLKKVIVLGKNSTLNENAFYQCDTIEYLEFKEGLKTIEYSALVDCTSLKELIIPKNVDYIEESPFINCSSLCSITIPFIGKNTKDYETLGYFFGFNCCNEDVPETLKTLVILEGCEYIGNAFEYCTSLTSITIPSSVTQFTGFFDQCQSLSYLIVPSELLKDYGGGFPTGLQSVYQNGLYAGPTNYPYLKLLKVLDKNVDAFTIHEDTIVIGFEALSGCEFESIDIPKNVYMIDSYAFGGSSFKNLVIPDNVRIVNTDAFQSCNIDTLTAPTTYEYYDCESSFVGANIGNYKILDGTKKLSDSIHQVYPVIRFVTIPKTVEIIDYYAFAPSDSFMRIYYEGTVDEFKRVVITDKYSTGKTIRKVVCSDGELVL